LELAVAWCGNPKTILPYNNLKKIGGHINATLGVGFYNTHPDAFEWLQSIGAKVRVFRDEGNLFHPKVYLFREKKRYALFMGSSNFTYHGFYANCEMNCLLEGTLNQAEAKEIATLIQTLGRWRTSQYSFEPKACWINTYRSKYEEKFRAQQRAGIHTPSRKEDATSLKSWLRYADWDVYYGNVRGAFELREDGGGDYDFVLDAAIREVPIPWNSSIFNDIENRRIIGGLGHYGALGHVGASGQFRSILANGSSRQRAVIANSVNSVASLNLPLPWGRFKTCLDHLCDLGPTMKVWSRILCLIRPDIYFTVAAPSVRKKLSQAIGMT
jgi:hypothetical protein